MPGTVDRYQLLDTIGAGTLGVLHRARDLQKGRTVALRLVSGTLVEDAAARAELLAEARRVAELSHPVVASLYECGEADDGVFIGANDHIVGHEALVAYAERLNPG